MGGAPDWPDIFQRLRRRAERAGVPHWFRYGAEYGVANSQWFLSCFYRNGRAGIAANPIEAYVWLKLAIPRLLQGEYRNRAEADLDSLVGTLSSDRVRQANAYLGNIIPGVDLDLLIGE